MNTSCCVNTKRLASILFVILAFTFADFAATYADEPKNARTIAEFVAQLPKSDAPMASARIPNKKPAKSNQRVVVSLSGDRRLDVFGVSASGTLALQSQTEIEGEPGASLFDQTGRHLYVATNLPSTISVLAVKSKGFEQVQSVLVDAKPSYLAMDPSGRYLLASYYKTGQVTVHQIMGEGRLSDKPVQSLAIDPRAHSVTFDGSGKFVFVSHTQTNSITQFRFDDQAGMLKLNSPSRLQREDRIGPRHLWFHPSGKFAYGSDESGRSISAYKLDAEVGTLTHLQTLPSFSKEFVGKGSTSRVQVHSNGRFAYIANRSEGSIAVYAIEQDTGRIRFLQRAPTESIVRGFNISPDGKWLIAAGQRSGDLVSYRIVEDGQLKAASKLAAGRIPWWISSFPSIEQFSN